MSRNTPSTKPPGPPPTGGGTGKQSKKVKMAKSVSVYVCAHRAVYLRLHDGSGRIFAAGILPHENGVELAAQIMDGLENPPALDACEH